MRFHDHFSTLSGAYAAFRPGYPPALADWLAQAAPGRALAWDCACGTGQFSRVLAGAVERVVASDASAAQIAAAAPHPRIDYRVAPAEDSGLPAGRFDLVTVAQAAHWLDRPAFYAEARRVAVPGALLALITYGAPVLADVPLNEILQDFRRVIAGDWPLERQLVEEGYRSLDFPFPELAAPPFEMAFAWSLPALLGYVSTWSALAALRARGGEGELEAFAAALAAAWGAPETERRIAFPLSLRVGRL